MYIVIEYVEDCATRLTAGNGSKQLLLYLKKRGHLTNSLTKPAAGLNTHTKHNDLSMMKDCGGI